MSGSLLERAYRGHRSRYLVRALFVQKQLLDVVIVALVAGLSLYVSMSLGQFVRLALLACAFQLLYSVLSLPLERRLTASVSAWVDGRRSEQATIEAWRAAAAMPWQLMRRGFTGFPVNLAWLFYLLSCLYLVWQLHLPACGRRPGNSAPGISLPASRCSRPTRRASLRAPSTRWPRGFRSASGSARRSAPTWTVRSPSTSSSKGPHWPARSWR